MLDAGDLDCQRRNLVEKHTVVAHTETKFIAWRAELLYISSAVGEVIIEAAQDSEGCFAINGAQLVSRGAEILPSANQKLDNRP